MTKLVFDSHDHGELTGIGIVMDDGGRVGHKLSAHDFHTLLSAMAPFTGYDQKSRLDKIGTNLSGIMDRLAAIESAVAPMSGRLDALGARVGTILGAIKRHNKEKHVLRRKGKISRLDLEMFRRNYK